MKRGQITLFVIIGIVLLLVVVGGILFFRSIIQDKGDVVDETQLIPVQNFVQSCLYSVGKDAVILAGEHGGYVNPQKHGITSNSIAPTEENGISIIGDSERIPYWLYLKSSNECKTGCVMASEKPPLSATEDSAIERQIAAYIEQNIPACLANLTPLEDQGIVASHIGKPKASVFIKDDDIELGLDQEISATYEGKTRKMKKFSTVLPVRFKRAYELAQSIMLYEENPEIRFFERKTMQIVSAYGLGDSPELPPIDAGIDVGTDARSWQLNRVNERIRAILEDHSSVFSIAQTRNSQLVFTEDNTFNGIYNDFALPVEGIQNPEDFSVDFIYLQDWPIYVSVSPRKGNAIQGEKAKVMFFVPMTINQFYYDISYPMVVSIRDHSAFSGEGFNLNYAFEVNVRNNKALNFSGEVLSVSKESSTLFCDEAQKKTGAMTFAIADKAGNPVQDASVTFECGDQACHLGTTDASGRVIGKLPLCVNGYIKTNHDDYWIPSQGVDATLGNSNTVALTAEKYIDVEVTVKKVNIAKIPVPGAQSTWVLDPTVKEDLQEDDTAEITIERQDRFADPVAESIQIKGTELSERHTIRMVPGHYDLQILLLTSLGNDSISKRTINIAINGTAIDSPSALMIGSYEIKSTNGVTWTVNSGDIATKKITIYVPAVDVSLLTTSDDLTNFMMTLETLSVSTSGDLAPVFG